MNIINCYLFIENIYKSQNNESISNLLEDIFKDLSIRRIPKKYDLILYNAKTGAPTSSSDSHKEYKITYNYENNDYNITLELTKSKNVKDHNVEYLKVNICSRCNIRKNAIDVMELLDSKLQLIKENNFFLVYAYDSISEYYCKKLYKDISKLERKTREILAVAFICRGGYKYYEKFFCEDFTNEKKNGLGKTTVQRTEHFIENLYFSDYRKILFNNDYYNYKNDSFSEIYFTNNYYERFFKAKLPESITEDLKDIENVRNIVMHSRFFRKDMYEKTKEKIKKYNKFIDKIFADAGREDFYELDYLKIAKMLKMINDSIERRQQEFSKKFQLVNRFQVNKINDNKNGS